MPAYDVTLKADHHRTAEMTCGVRFERGQTLRLYISEEQAAGLGSQYEVAPVTEESTTDTTEASPRKKKSKKSDEE